MPGGRRRGMDHDIYPFSPLPERPPFRLPRSERVAFFVLLHLESWELLPPDNAYRDPRFRNEFGNYFPEYRVWTYREYGARVGVFRVLGEMDNVNVTIVPFRLGRRPTLAPVGRDDLRRYVRG